MCSSVSTQPSTRRNDHNGRICAVPTNILSYVLINSFLFLFVLVPQKVIGLTLLQRCVGKVGSKVGTSSKHFLLAFFTPDLIYHPNSTVIYSNVVQIHSFYFFRGCGWGGGCVFFSGMVCKHQVGFQQASYAV